MSCSLLYLATLSVSTTLIVDKCELKRANLDFMKRCHNTTLQH